MSYDYGSTTIEIPNPFKLEGALETARGVVITTLGIIVVLSMREQVIDGRFVTGWPKFVGAFLLLGFGLEKTASGLFRVFRFYVGRGIPADLSGTKKNPGHKTAYEVKELKEMLMGRTNVTFKEPVSWLSRLLHTLDGNLLFLAPRLREAAESLFETGVLTIALTLLYGLALFSAATGLIPIRGTPVPGWLGWMFVVAMFGLWWFNRPRFRRTPTRKPRFRFSRMMAWSAEHKPALAIFVAILASTILGLIYKAGALPAVPLSPLPWILLLVIGGSVVCLASIIMISLKKPSDAPPTEVSEFRDQWQESVHPLDIFRAFDMTMADFRFQEIPNRTYEERDPRLVDEKKGTFSGSMVQETQPIPQPAIVSPALGRLRQANLVMGQVLLLAGAICFFVLLTRPPTAGGIIRLEWGLTGVVFVLFGLTMAVASHLVYSEVPFQSRVLHLLIDNGTFARSKVSTGMAFHDSTRSENELVRSSLSPWLLCTRIQSVTYAESGAGKLEQHRYVLKMEKDDAFLDGVVDALRHFISSRQLVAGITAKADFGAADIIHRMNEVTRVRSGPVPTIPADNGPQVFPTLER
jgi:hypothetical protein